MLAPVLDNFVVLEGLDGSGTTTQVQRLAAALAALGVPAHATREPTDGPVGLLLRRALRREIRLTGNTLAHLFAADRSEHCYGDDGIVARCAAGTLVISDRYLFSSLAYQDADTAPGSVARLNQEFPLPGHLIFLDASPEVCARRRAGRGPAELFDDLERQQGIRRAYLEVVHRYQQTQGMQVHTLAGDAPEDVVAARLWQLLLTHPLLRTRDQRSDT